MIIQLTLGTSPQGGAIITCNTSLGHKFVLLEIHKEGFISRPHGLIKGLGWKINHEGQIRDFDSDGVEATQNANGG